MNDNLKESLSALMDNEADPIELRRILKQSPLDEDVLQTWERWHLISASLRQEAHVRPRPNILEGVRAALEQEPLPRRATPVAHPARRVLRAVGQSAIAASVVGAVLFFAPTFNADTAVQADLASSTAQPNTTGTYQPGELTRMASFSESADLEQDALARLREAVYREFERRELPGSDPRIVGPSPEK